MIEVRGLRKEVPQGGRTLTILKGIDLSVPAGQVLAIMGPSGSGKSTLLGQLAGLDAPSSGSVSLAGVEVTGLNEDALARFRGENLGFVFQAFNLIPTLTAQENVELPLELSGRGQGAAERARELLDAVGLSHRRSHYPAQLSGGEQQRVAIARAFATRPKILLADEPTGNLDSDTGQAVLRLLLELNRQEGTTLVLVTHDRSLADRADRVVTLRDGEVVADTMQLPAAAQPLVVTTP